MKRRKNGGLKWRPAGYDGRRSEETEEWKNKVITGNIRKSGKPDIIIVCVDD